MENLDIINDVVDEFALYAAIPRPSQHEEAISNFLKQHLTELGFSVVQDEYFNIIADLPATEGCEAAPVTILQGHMDMVCVAAPGYSYDPLKDPIKLVRGEKYLEAEGTSLGADDGMGVAVAVYSAIKTKKHGPIRIIVTVDEESGMTGATKLDKKHLTSADFVINCDSESSEEIVVGSAGSVTITLSKEMETEEVGNANAYVISAHHFLGGHSGVCINDNHANAIKHVAAILSRLIEAGVEYRIASISGGKVPNAIPADAAVTIVTDAAEAQIQDAVSKEQERFISIYGDLEKDAVCGVEKTSVTGQIFSIQDTKKLVAVLTALHSGVHAMERGLSDHVESSANLGVIKTDGNKVTTLYFPRSSFRGKLVEFCNTVKAVGFLSGFNVECGEFSPAWARNHHSKIVPIAQDVFKGITGKDLKVDTLHAGLECGYFINQAPQLDILSIGVNTYDIHSSDERVELESIVLAYKLISGVLERIADLKKA